MVTIATNCSCFRPQGRRLLVAISGVLLVATSLNAQAQQGPEPTGTPHGGGSTFVQPLLAAWAAVYKEEAKTEVEYDAVGSDRGMALLHSGLSDFSAIDRPLSAERLGQENWSQFPLAVGAVAVVVNLPGVKSGELHFSGPLLAEIFAGRIKQWNDAAIIAMNPGVPLPKAPIEVIYRADSSGTTYNFTHYLSDVSPWWKKRFGEGDAVRFATGIAAVGDGSVARGVAKIANSIGYTEYAYVLMEDLAYACLQDFGGHVICPSAESFGSAVEKTAWDGTSDFDMAVINTPTARSYPIMATTFIVMPAIAKGNGRSEAAVRFFLYALDKGQDEAKALSYVPLPPQLVSRIKQYLSAKIK